MKILLLELDGKLPNLALMRIAAHHKRLGDEVVLRRIVRAASVDNYARRIVGKDSIFDAFDRIYASLIFSKTKPVAEALLKARPDAIVGGTGWDDYGSDPMRITSLEEIGIFSREVDYTLYPNFKRSIGYTQLGCRMTSKTCGWCSVPLREGKVRAIQTIEQLWRGAPYPRELLLLDNDFFGQPDWRSLIAAIREGGFRVSFNQGINARMINDEVAAAIASIKYRDDDFKKSRIYTAWDSKPDEKVLFRGLESLVRHGIKADNIMVYLLISFDAGGFADWDYRRARLREFGARPYPMPFVRSTEAVGFQRWVIGAYDRPRLIHDPEKHEQLEPEDVETVRRLEDEGVYYHDDKKRLWCRAVKWEEWVRAKYQPANLPGRKLRRPQRALELQA
jgi:hypothetical protein